MVPVSARPSASPRTSADGSGARSRLLQKTGQLFRAKTWCRPELDPALGTGDTARRPRNVTAQPSSSRGYAVAALSRRANWTEREFMRPAWCPACSAPDVARPRLFNVPRPIGSPLDRPGESVRPPPSDQARRRQATRSRLRSRPRGPVAQPSVSNGDRGSRASWRCVIANASARNRSISSLNAGSLAAC